MLWNKVTTQVACLTVIDAMKYVFLTAKASNVKRQAWDFVLRCPRRMFFYV